MVDLLMKTIVVYVISDAELAVTCIALLVVFIIF